MERHALYACGFASGVDAFALLTCPRVAKVSIWGSVALISVPVTHRRTGRSEGDDFGHAAREFARPAFG
jgi:hypothetical protein